MWKKELLRWRDTLAAVAAQAVVAAGLYILLVELDRLSRLLGADTWFWGPIIS